MKTFFTELNEFRHFPGFQISSDDEFARKNSNSTKFTKNALFAAEQPNFVIDFDHKLFDIVSHFECLLKLPAISVSLSSYQSLCKVFRLILDPDNRAFWVKSRYEQCPYSLIGDFLFVSTAC